MFFNKHKKKVNKEIEEIQDDVRIKKVLGAKYACLPITSHSIENVKDWCAREGYKFEVDHMTDGVIYYKISGWN